MHSCFHGTAAGTKPDSVRLGCAQGISTVSMAAGADFVPSGCSRGVMHLGEP